MYDDSADLNDALKDTYVRILKNLPGLAREVLFMPWSCRIAFRVWKDAAGINDDESPVVTSAGTYSLTQILHLPVTESQILIMHFYQKIEIRDIAAIMNFDSSLVRQAIRSAYKHLRHSSGGDLTDVKYEENAGSKYRPQPGLSENAVVPAAILKKVFDECGRRMVKSSRKFSLSRKCLRRSPRMRIRNRVR